MDIRCPQKRYLPPILLLIAFFITTSSFSGKAHAMENMMMAIPRYPFFLINGQPTSFYPIRTSSLPGMTMPRNVTPETYVVMQDLQFAIDRTKFPIPEDIQKQAEFTWEFGDGEKALGLKTKHAYKKVGSFIATFHVRYGEKATDTLSQTILLNIVPMKKYQLPQAMITVNNTPVANTDMYMLPGQAVHFDGTKSTAASSQIASYLWDFGDGFFADTPSASHTYKQGYKRAIVVLRVTDANSFISDSSMTFTDTPLMTTKKAGSNVLLKQNPFVFPTIIILIAIGAFLLFRKKLTKPKD